MKALKTPVKARYLSPKGYLKDVELNRKNNNIDSVVFIPPEIGKSGFGRFLVKYKIPVLVNR
ncbi:hypothetical protein FHQ26_11715 [Testudinibacter sp. TR-2022]|uniref:hypothetical protein n=1 Tax=Testudinibacter sp. TR-2022 TaxID=2585029 RepID=UPI001117EE51|nr:hypothetical protein [Testudinibacter sp. TR-2022]TNH02201.1 hypothetical protein FHQ22_10470 [Pasteurellaceae bacterium Phil31]TNH05597.1 hypothetical protein FHQ26_11715 [Testudinibacter sp. TR-2022]TNH08823.1 hypothetical protein FHQ25_08935 [Testudinibacter sp. TR-2022]TNH14479.1 hypothetical protein FHQ23_11060 [Testudinibacter sp. TR-2022]TNH15472.1 hypothetical protein FIA56_03330 [Testudinibacter sp. TR-2022]